MSTAQIMAFYHSTAIENWTCYNVTNYYNEKTGQKERKKILDCIKKDLQEVEESDSFDVMKRRKAREILDDWKNWVSLRSLEKDSDYASVNIGHLQVNQLATGDRAIFYDNRCMKHRQDSNNEEEIPNTEEPSKKIKTTIGGGERRTLERQIHPPLGSAEEVSPVTTPLPDPRDRSPPPSYRSGNNSLGDHNEASPSNDHDESDTRHEDDDENPFIIEKGKGSRNNEFKTILSWKHAINNINLNNISGNDWVEDGHNISLDFRNFQSTSVKQLETNPIFSYEKDVDRILCLSSIMYCNELKPEYVTCSEKLWNNIRPGSLVPKMLPPVVQLMIIEYNMYLNEKQSLDMKWHENWAKWSTLSTDEDKSIFDCAQEVTKNFFMYLSSVSFDEDKKLDEDTFVHRYCHRILEEIFNKEDFTLIWANGESKSSKERRMLDGKNHGRKPDFRVLSKIDDINVEFLFGEIKPPINSTSINRSLIKLAEFTKGSLDLIIDRCGYVDGLETYGVLIHGSEIKIFSMDLTFDGLYRYNQLSKILLPTENANFLNILTVISTFYSLLERIRSNIVTMNLSQPSSSSGHLYCRKSNSSPKKIRVPIVRV